MPEYRVGISGWRYPPWRGVFYPTGLRQRDELSFVAERLNSVEINGSFYALQRPSSYQQWFAQTPSGFVFAVKGPRFVTHMKKLADVRTPVANFLASGVLALAGKLGPVLWQLPPNFHRNDERLAQALARLPPGRHAFEFRHPTWFTPDVYELLRRHSVALVVADRPEVRRFQVDERTADFVFLRFHHGGGDGNYSHRQLGSWARRIEEWRREGDVYAYFNNDWAGYAVENGLWLKHRLG